MQRWIDHIAMGVMLGNAAVLARLVRVQDLLTLTESFKAQGPKRMDPRRAERIGYRMTKWIPGVSCLHQAAATKVWLSAHGIPSRLVIGFRSGESFEGHAWLELDDGSSLFEQDGDPYQSIMSDS